KYRAPFVLCHLQGQTNEEAARELGRPVGTILSQLSRARQKLRDRLHRRGFAPSIVLPALDLLPGEMSPSLSAALVRAAVRAAGVGVHGAGDAALAPAQALAKGVLMTMFLTRVKAAAVALAAAVLLGVGGGVAGLRSDGRADEPETVSRPAPKKAGAGP